MKLSEKYSTIAAGKVITLEDLKLEIEDKIRVAAQLGEYQVVWHAKSASAVRLAPTLRQWLKEEECIVNCSTFDSGSVMFKILF